MDRRESEALDRHITGNGGEDQFGDFEDWFENPECQVSNCHEESEDGVLCTRHLAEQEAADDQSFRDETMADLRRNPAGI